MIKEEIITDEKTVKELEYLQKLWEMKSHKDADFWEMKNPKNADFKEFENLCLKYWYVDSFELIK